jgi:inorganic pyrophosphatase
MHYFAKTLLLLVCLSACLAANTAPPQKKYAVPDVSFSDAGVSVFIVLISIAGFAFGIYWWWYLDQHIKIEAGDDPHHPGSSGTNAYLTKEIMEKTFEISKAISDGATTFLFAEYKYMAVFIVVFGFIMFLLLGSTSDNYWGKAGFSLFSFIVGSVTSIASGWIGMRIAVFTNARTAVQATVGAADGNTESQFRSSFQTAFRGGLTMGFCLTSVGLLSLFINICICKAKFDLPEDVYECVAAFGLGGSAIACFGRVGGGIYTKAADVGSDLVGKVEQGIPEDDPRNPGVIADCIGDNVGDIAGMGSDLFGSFGEATCAALVVASTSPELTVNFGSMMYPLVITAVGILVCMGTSNFASVYCTVKDKKSVEPALALQLGLATICNSVVILLFTYLCLPSEFHLKHVFPGPEDKLCKWWYAYLCVMTGLWAGLIIGYVTYYYTSNSHRPVQEVAESCRTGAATNVIYGLALGYVSVCVPTVCIAITIYISYNLCLLYGFALAALGILSTMSIGLTIDAYGPISDNAGGIAEMAEMGKDIRAVTDALDAAGNTTAAIGKGFAISSAAFVSLALYGAFLTRVVQTDVPGEVVPLQIQIVDPRVMCGLFLGSMLPFWFSAMTMKSVGEAAMSMVEEIRRQFKEIPGLMEGRAKPDYNKCVEIATVAALRKMIPPGCLVILSPIVIGIFLGKEALAGLLPGALVTGVQLAISSSNTGGAWDNAKKYIEGGGMPGIGKGSAVHCAAVVGDTVGDPLKDTSGPSLNILIKLMAIISVVFAPVTRSPSIGGILFDKAFSGFNEDV